MSKAKELATRLKPMLEDIPLSGFATAHEKMALVLVDAVLSEPEPEPELRGWIEVTSRSGAKKLINLSLVENVGVDNGLTYLELNRDDCVAYVKESYEEIKQKIMESQ